MDSLAAAVAAVAAVAGKLSRKQIATAITIIVILLLALAYVFYVEENKPIEVKQDYNQLREQKIKEFSSVFNEQIISEEQNYGYKLMSETVKDQRFKNSMEYKIWLEKLKNRYPDLGTDNVVFTVGNVEDYIADTNADPKNILTLILQETEDAFLVEEIIGYYGGKTAGSKTYYPECKLIFAEKNTDSNCPKI